MKTSLFPFILCLLNLLLPGSVLAFDYDPKIGEEINDVCAGCHGEFGQGGRDGEYPRLAGMPTEFLSKQLHLFRNRKRPNLAMVEYVDERQMPDEDIYQISRYLSEIQLTTRLPAVDESAPDFNAYERLLESKKLMQIARAPGNIEAGKQLYKKECGTCHGADGYGNQKKAVPLLAGQYTNYLWRQVKKLRNKIRIHDPDEPDSELLDSFNDTELTDIFAWLSTADD